MTQNHFLQETFFDRVKHALAGPLRFFPVWKDLLFLSLIIISVIAALLVDDVIPIYRARAEYTNREVVRTEWEAASGDVAGYQLEITDTRFFPGDSSKGSITMVKYATSPGTGYALRCEHNHAYRMRVAAVSPAGIFSSFSRKSTLLICDQQSPRIEIEPLASPGTLRYPAVSIRGTFIEPNIESIHIDGTPARIDLMKRSFSAPIDLIPGRNNLTVVARDLAGNQTVRTISLDYVPVTIVSLPAGARIYWNGNYAYRGIYSGNTPQAFNQAVQGKQVLCLTYPGYNDSYSIIDFSSLTEDTYTIELRPFSGFDFMEAKEVVCNNRPIAVGQCAYPFAVDDNLDGRKDLLVGTGEGTIALFSNTGTDDNPVFKDYALLRAGDEVIDVGTGAAPFVVDYNNDGAKDLLVGSGDGSLMLFFNRGDNPRPVYDTAVALKDAQGTDISVGSSCTPFMVDWNKDNRKDLLLGSGQGTLSIYINEGTDSNPLFSAARSVEADGSAIGAASLAAPFMADCNGDGRQDLLVGDGDGSIHLYLDVGTGTDPQFMAAGTVKVNDDELAVEGSAVPFLIDWNNDGRKDLLVGSLSGDIYLFTD